MIGPVVTGENLSHQGALSVVPDTSGRIADIVAYQRGGDITGIIILSDKSCFPR